MKATAWTLLAVFSITSGSALAYDDVVQSDIGFFVQTMEGKPAMCGIEFTIVFKDNINKMGALSVVTGSVTTAGVRGYIGTIFKMTGGDTDSAGKLNPYRPSVVSLYSPTTGPINKYIEFPCEQAIGFCARYELDSTALIAVATLKNDDLRVRFNRAKGQLDVELPISTRKAIASHPAEYTEYVNCSRSLMDEARAALGAK